MNIVFQYADGVDVRTMASASNKHSNRLSEESSPYLLQHAANPVDWYPWGEAAFEKAKSEMKPIFLSVGYSTCHWCHVMERESFEDIDTAVIINDNFVAIKVDREERPDVDSVYMSYVQATRGHGGWPMTVFLTPDLKPFFGGTYFPKQERYGMPSFNQILTAIATTWNEQQQMVIDQSNDTMKQLSKHLMKRDASPEVSDIQATIDRFINGCTESLMDSFDPTHGGFGSAPKFPRPSELHVLLANAVRCSISDNDKANGMMDAVKWTLETMSNGGIYDHIGGGFHRYSVDELWHVPHFEKMLYDNPQIAIAYLHMYQFSKDQKWAMVACGILDYLKREMTDPLGGIYAAEDADSMDTEKGEKTEGAFYVWKETEVKEILDDQEYEVFSAYYDVRQDGNCHRSQRSDPHSEFVGKNCFYVSKDLNALSHQFGMETDVLVSVLAKCRKKLYTQRLQRPKPHLDNKIVAAWNGMAISAFAQASNILRGALIKEAFPITRCPPAVYLDDAKRIAECIISHLWDDKQEILMRSYCGGQQSVTGYADDYAWVIAGFLDLYEHSGELKWLRWALKLQHRMDDIFYDQTSGGYFSTSGEDPSILLRLKEKYDSAEPAASSLALSNLVRLSSLLSSNSDAWMDKAHQTIQSIAAPLEKTPSALPQFGHSMFLYEGYPKSKKIVISTEDTASISHFLDVIHKHYIPCKAVLVIDLSDPEALAFWKVHSLENVRVLGDVVHWNNAASLPTVTKKTDPTVYVCANFTCKAPTQDPNTLERQLTAVSTDPVAIDIDVFQPKK